MKKKLISIVSPTFNEESNVDELYRRVISAIEPLSRSYDFELIIIDNNSDDKTVDKLKAIARVDKRLKVIINVRNFGHIRSPYYGIMQSRGDATIYLASDLQDPPEMIGEFLVAWEKGYKLVMATKPKSQESKIFNMFRRLYYTMLDSVSEVRVIKNSTGFGLYDREILKHLEKINDPYPFLRGLIAELGYPVKQIEFFQPKRAAGISKNNIYTLYDIAWLGFVTHSKIPIRISGFFGLVIGLLSLCIALIYFILKLLFWSSIPFGMAPVLIGLFFLLGAQFIFIGVLGEYIAQILIYLQNRPVVIEKERINFEERRID